MPIRNGIRNHFEGLDKMAAPAVTVSWRALGHATLIGVRLRISSRTGIPALDASESYIREHVAAGSRDQAALTCVVMIPVQLIIQEAPTRVGDEARTR